MFKQANNSMPPITPIPPKKPVGRPPSGGLASKKLDPAFLCFVRENGSRFAAQHSEKGTHEINMLLAMMWQSLSPDQKLPYQQMAGVGVQKAALVNPEEAPPKMKKKRTLIGAE